jgi:putative flippase GtrA
LSPPLNKAGARRFGRFSLAGIVNTLVGYAVIFGALALGLSPYFSNFLGYSVGLACSFFLNKSFVFAATGNARKQAVRFLAAFLFAYLTNLAVLHISLRFGAGDIIAQLLGGGIYLLTMYQISRLWVFKN